jgi:hypothetical protein
MRTNDRRFPEPKQVSKVTYSRIISLKCLIYVEAPEQGIEDLDTYLQNNQKLIENNHNKLEDYLELQSSILTKKLKDYDVSKMVMKETPEKQLDSLKNDLLTNNTSMTPVPVQTQVNYKKEMEKKKKIFMTEMVEEELENEKKKPLRPTAKFIEQRNTRYDNNLTDSSQIPELKSNIGKKQGMNLMKSNSMRKYKHLDTNEVIDNCDVEMTNFKNMTIKEQDSSVHNRTASQIIQNKLNDYMTQNTQTSVSKNFPRPTDDTTLGSIMDIPEEEARKRFLTLNKQSQQNQLANYQMIQNQFRTNIKNDPQENVGNSQYLRTVVHGNDGFTDNWGTRIEEEEGVEMGEIMMDNSGSLKMTGQTDFNEKLEQLKRDQDEKVVMGEAKKNSNYDSPVKREDLSETLGKSIHSELFEDSTAKKKKKERSKSPELLVIIDDAPVKKRKFRLGKSRKKTPKKKVKEEEASQVKEKPEEEKHGEKESRENKEGDTKNINISMPKGIELNFGFESKFKINIMKS